MTLQQTLPKRYARWHCRYPGCDRSGVGYANKVACGPTHRSGLWRMRHQKPDAPVVVKPPNVAVQAEIRRRMRGAPLSTREAWVLCGTFGLDGNAPRSLASLAEEIGVSRQRILQIKTKALARIGYPSPEIRVEPSMPTRSIRIEARRRQARKSA